MREDDRLGSAERQPPDDHPGDIELILFHEGGQPSRPESIGNPTLTRGKGPQVHTLLADKIHGPLFPHSGSAPLQPDEKGGRR